MHQESGFPLVTVRPPFVHGPRQPFYREQFFWDRMLDDRPIVLPDQGERPMQWACVSDVADACVRAIEVPAAAGESFNVAHVEKTTQRTFLEALARAAGVAATLVPVPRAVIEAAGGQLIGPQIYFGEFLDLPPFTELVEKAPRLLGVAPTPLDTALAESFAWYRTQPRRLLDYAFEDQVLAHA
jgi:nucleoside-diphosphate-sugar epimerase